MANRLSMADIQAIRSLHASGNSDRRISALLGVHRETVAKHTAAPAGMANAPTSDGSDAAASGPPEPEGASSDQNQPNAPTGSTPAQCELRTRKPTAKSRFPLANRQTIREEQRSTPFQQPALTNLVHLPVLTRP
jgi:hypothetical protein